MLASLAPTGAKPLSLQLAVGGSTVKQVNTLKYLCVHIDQRLTFTQHAITSATRSRRMLAVVSNTLRRWRMRAEIARIYTACIRPVLSYAAGVAYARTDEGRRAVERVNRAAARLVLNTYIADYSDMLQKLRWPTIASLATREQLRLAHVYANSIGSDDETESANAPIWTAMQTQSARRSARLSNGRDLRVTGPRPRLAHAHNTTLRTMVELWNALPASVVQQPTSKQFMIECNKITQSLSKCPTLR
jgi:hypothetical protein